MNTLADKRAGAVKPKILILTPWITRPDAAAGDVRLFAMLQILAQSSHVDLYTTQESHCAPEVSRYKQDLQRIGVSVLENEALGLELALLRCSYDIVLFEFWHSAEQHISLIRRQQPAARIVIDTVDIHFLREEAGTALGLFEPAAVQQNKRREIETYQQADLVIVVTQEDCDALISEKIIAPLRLVPMIVPIRARQKKPRTQELLFVGGFNHAPNADGLLWFVSDCWPAIRSQVPAATLTVVGIHPPQEVLDLDHNAGITVAGFVPETAPYLDKACLSVAPLRFGAGMKGKVTEAMAAGLPVVTTTFGAQGLSPVPGRHLLVADEPSLFAEHVVTLLTEPDRLESMGLAGQDHIKKLCSAEVVEQQLKEILDLLMKTSLKQSPISVLTTLAHRGAAAGKLALLYGKRPVKKLIKRFYTPKRTSNRAVQEQIGTK